MSQSPVKLSPSSMSTLKDCPLCFWLAFNKKISPPGGIFPSLPSGMDLVLKKHFDAFREKGKMPEELNGTGARLFNDMDLLKVWRSNFKGIRWTDSKGNVLRGAVDEILEKDGKLIGIVTNRDVIKYSHETIDLLMEQSRLKGPQLSDHYTAFGKCEGCGDSTHLIFQDSKFVCDNCAE